MNKTLIVAQSECSTLVRSKAFLIGVILMPVVMAGSIFLVNKTRDTADVKDRTFAYVDHSGVVGAQLEEAARALNAGESAGARTGPRFLPVAVDAKGRNLDEVRLELSNRVREQELFAFVEFPADVLDPQTSSQIRYYSDTPSYVALPEWLRGTTARIVEGIRFRAAGVDPALVNQLTRPLAIEQLGLISRDAAGGIEAAKQVDRVRAMAVPFAFLMLMYITVMSSAPQLLNSVMEEKMGRISEVLIASVTPFQLMMGKLLGSVAVSVLLAFIYIGGALAVASYWGYAGAASASQLGWFALFLPLAVLLFGSLFIAIGAACSDLKDSQNLVTPVMLLVMLPMITAGPILRAPDGVMATGLSLLPTAAPFLMMLRISMQPGPPFWQIVVSVALMLATVLVCVWAAGRIFRTGLLMQGKSATIGEMIRWVRAG